LSMDAVFQSVFGRGFACRFDRAGLAFGCGDQCLTIFTFNVN